MNDQYPTNRDQRENYTTDVSLVNEFDPKKDPLWYILRKAEISFERIRLLSEEKEDGKNES